MFKKKKPILIPTSYKERKIIRYRLMRIRNNNDDVKDDLKEQIEKQFTDNMAWSNYSEVWDVEQKNSYKIIKL